MNGCRLLKPLEERITCQSLIVFQNGNIAVCSDNQIIIFDPLNDFECINIICEEVFRNINSLILLSDNNLACIVSSIYFAFPHILILDHNSSYKISQLLHSNNFKQYTCLVETVNGNIINGFYNGELGIWDKVANNGYRYVKTIFGHISFMSILTFSKRDGLLFSGSSDKTIKIWDCLDNFKCVNTIEANHNIVCSPLILPGGYFVISISNNVRIYRLRDFKCINSWEAYGDRITSFECLKIIG
jgi:WD40 repeat protein